jgi:hypothetical protein
MDQRSDYTAAWRNYRKRRLVSWAVFLSYVPGAMATFLGVGLPLSSLTGVKADYFFYPIGGAWMLAVLITSMRTVLFPCPPLRQVLLLNLVVSQSIRASVCALRLPEVGDVRLMCSSGQSRHLGSQATRSTPINGHHQAGPIGPVRANIRRRSAVELFNSFISKTGLEATSLSSCGTELQSAGQ